MPLETRTPFQPPLPLDEAIGARTNVQDGSVLHADEGVPLTVGPSVSVGHQAMLHGCMVGEGTLVGIKAVVLKHALIGRDCLVRANTLLPEGTVIPERSLVVGSSGHVVCGVTDEEVAWMRHNADHYAEHAR